MRPPFKCRMRLHKWTRAYEKGGVVVYKDGARKYCGFLRRHCMLCGEVQEKPASPEAWLWGANPNWERRSGTQPLFPKAQARK